MIDSDVGECHYLHDHNQKIYMQLYDNSKSI